MNSHMNERNGEVTISTMTTGHTAHVHLSTSAYGLCGGRLTSALSSCPVSPFDSPQEGFVRARCWG